MKWMVIILLFLPLVSSTQTDFNYEFVTSTDAKLYHTRDTLNDLNAAVREMALHLPCRVIKHYNELLIVSPIDYSNVRYQGKVTFVGIEQPFRGFMEYLDERGNRVQIDPVRQLVRIYQMGKLKAQYGISNF